MERWQILRGAGGLLIGIGLLIAIGGVVLLGNSDSETKNEQIPAGYYLYFVTTSAMSGASVSGSYSVSPGAVDFFVFTEAQYHDFVSLGSSDYIYYKSQSSSGTFDVALPGTGIFYMVVYNPSMTATTDQQFTITYVLKGMAWTPTIIGGVMIAAGALLIFFGIRSKASKDRELEELTSVVRVEGNEPINLVSEAPSAEQPVIPANEVTSPRTRTVRRPPQPPM